MVLRFFCWHNHKNVFKQSHSIALRYFFFMGLFVLLLFRRRDLRWHARLEWREMKKNKKEKCRRRCHFWVWYILCLRAIIVDSLHFRRLAVCCIFFYTIPIPTLRSFGRLALRRQRQRQRMRAVYAAMNGVDWAFLLCVFIEQVGIDNVVRSLCVVVLVCVCERAHERATNVSSYVCRFVFLRVFCVWTSEKHEQIENRIGSFSLRCCFALRSKRTQHTFTVHDSKMNSFATFDAPVCSRRLLLRRRRHRRRCCWRCCHRWSFSPLSSSLLPSFASPWSCQCWYIWWKTRIRIFRVVCQSFFVYSFRACIRVWARTRSCSCMNRAMGNDEKMPNEFDIKELNETNWRCSQIIGCPCAEWESHAGGENSNFKQPTWKSSTHQ